MASRRLFTDLRPLPIYQALALEAVRFDGLAPDEVVLFLWRSPPAVVIGKNQVPWRECRPNWLAGADIQLARRESGGGAVYHDPGNLNYSFLCGRRDYRCAAVMHLVVDALASLGVEARTDGRRLVTVAGGKVSGTAFRFRGERVLHHGTLLIDADLQRLAAALIPAVVADTHGVASQPMPVTNLTAVRPELTTAAVAAALAARFRQAYPGLRAGDAAADVAAVAQRRRVYRSWDWIFGRGPGFRVDLPLAAAGSNARLSLTVARGGGIEAAAVRPAGTAPALDKAAAGLAGVVLRPENLRRHLGEAGIAGAGLLRVLRANGLV